MYFFLGLLFASIHWHGGFGGRLLFDPLVPVTDIAAPAFQY